MIVHKATGEEVLVGHELTSWKGEAAIVKHLYPTGNKIYVEWTPRGFVQDLYLSVFDLERTAL